LAADVCNIEDDLPDLVEGFYSCCCGQGSVVVLRRARGWTVGGSKPTTSRQGESLSVRVLVFTLLSAVKVIAESVECLQSVV